MKVNFKRAITLAVLLVFVLISILVENPIIKYVFIGLTIVIISFIIFFRDGESSIQSKENSNDTSTEDDTENYDTDSGSNTKFNDKILTEEDLKLQTSPRISQLIPKDLSEQYRRIACEPVPGVSEDIQFNFVLEKTLELIKDIMLAHSVIFFWYRRDRGQIIFHNYVSEEKELQKIKFQIGSDLISKVIITAQPTYTSNINSNVEADLIRYYPHPVGIKSVAAVPVFLNEKLIGVLAVDSKSDDAFGSESIYSLGRFVRLITLILSIYDEKFNVELINQKLEALLELIGLSTRELDEKKLVQNFIVVLDKFIEWDVLAIVLYDVNIKNFVLKKVVNRTPTDYLGEGSPIDIGQDTLVGKSISSQYSIRIDDTGSNKYSIYRKNDGSNIKGSMMIIPINSGNIVYGAIVIESLKKKLYTDDDVRLIEKVTSHLGNQLDNLITKKILNDYLSIDLETLLLNKSTFEKRVKEELLKFKNTDMHIGLALIKVDKSENLIKKYSEKVIPKIAKHIALQLTKETEELMLLGRLEPLKFGVLFLNRDSAADNIWCQKIILKIASEMISYGDHQFAITVSVGYAGGVKLIKAETLFNSAETALNRAILDGGNKIRTIK